MAASVFRCVWQRRYPCKTVTNWYQCSDTVSLCSICSDLSHMQYKVCFTQCGVQITRTALDKGLCKWVFPFEKSKCLQWVFYVAGGWWCPGDDHVAAHQPVLVIRETQTRGSRPPLMNKNTVSHLVWRCDGFLFVSCFTICVLLVTISAHVQLVAGSSKQKLHLFSKVQDNVRMLFMGVKINNKCF